MLFTSCVGVGAQVITLLPCSQRVVLTVGSRPHRDAILWCRVGMLPSCCGLVLWGGVLSWGSVVGVQAEAWREGTFVEEVSLQLLHFHVHHVRVPQHIGTVLQFVHEVAD